MAPHRHWHRHFYRPRRLYTRLYLHFAGMLLMVGLALLGAFGLVFQWQGQWQGQWRSNPVHELAERFAAREAAGLLPDMADPVALSASVRRLAQDLDIDVTVRDADGAIRVAAGVALPPLLSSEVRWLKSGPRILTRHHRGPVFTAALIAADAASAPLGVLELSLARHLKVNLLRPLLALLLTLLVMAAATAPLARRLSRPIERLTEANQRLGGGDLSYRIPLPPGTCDYAASGNVDELMRLLTSWNEMAGRIQVLVRGHKDLLANVSHELRSPLARIRVALALLPVDAEVEARIADVEGDLGELERLIDDVLTTSQLEQSGLPLRMEQVEVRPLLLALAERAARTPLLLDKQVAVEGMQEPGMVLSADGGLLKRALWNLMENAAKYGRAPIVLSAEQREGRVIFHVTDRGAGIPTQERQRVLQPFYQVDRARTPGSGRGFGLGLTLALRIAEVHGGRLLLGPAEEKDGEEHGFRVSIEIPR